MEKRITTKVDEFFQSFKNDLRTKSIELGFTESFKIAELMAYVMDYNRVILEKEDFTKRKRIKNSIPDLNRCVAKLANGEQCTRRRKSECEFCGTHTKGTPHGLMAQSSDFTNTIQKVNVYAVEIKGIVYYVDDFTNVYKTEDVLENKENPQIVAHYVKSGNEYTIPEFGMV
jgi:hypothetical protein